MERRRKDEHEVVAGKNYFSEYLDQGAAEEGASPSSSSGKSANTNSSSDRIAVMDVGPEDGDDDNASSATSIYECGTLKTFYDDESQFYPSRNQRTIYSSPPRLPPPFSPLPLPPPPAPLPAPWTPMHNKMLYKSGRLQSSGRVAGRLRTASFFIGVVGLTFGIAAAIAYGVLQLSNFRQDLGVVPGFGFGPSSESDVVLANGVLSMSEVIYGFEIGIVAVCSALGIISNAFLVYAASRNARPFAFPFLVYHFVLAVALFLASFFIVFAVNPAENKAYAAITFAAAIFVIFAWEIVRQYAQSIKNKNKYKSSLLFPSPPPPPTLLPVPSPSPSSISASPYTIYSTIGRAPPPPPHPTTMPRNAVQGPPPRDHYYHNHTYPLKGQRNKKSKGGAAGSNRKSPLEHSDSYSYKRYTQL